MPTVTGLQLSVADVDESHPQLATDESYTLSLPTGGGVATVTSKSVYGALRALETFAQIVVFNFDTNVYTTTDFEIYDSPRFAHRGLMIDTASH